MLHSKNIKAQRVKKRKKENLFSKRKKSIFYSYFAVHHQTVKLITELEESKAPVIAELPAEIISAPQKSGNMDALRATCKVSGLIVFLVLSVLSRILLVWVIDIRFQYLWLWLNKFPLIRNTYFCCDINFENESINPINYDKFASMNLMAFAYI